MGRIFICLVILLGAQTSFAAETENVYREIAIAADHPAASEAGLETYRAGGNVVDVAAAVGFALAVVRPESSGLGGGGFLVFWDAEKQQAVTIDYRERAPAAASAGMYLGPDGEPIADLSRIGHKAAAIPHHVAGLAHAVQKYGRLDLATVLRPALRLANEGVPLDSHSVAVRKETLAQFEKNPELKLRYASFYRFYLANGDTPAVGQVFRSPLLNLLERIATQGPKGFYQGPAAEAFVREMERGGGLITLEDLKTTRPTERQALKADFAGGQIITMAPPSSGGVALIQILNTLTEYERLHPELAEQLKKRDSLGYRHALTEAMKHAFADRATYLGDPDYADVPTARLISKSYAERLANKISPARTYPLESYGRTLPVEDAGTTHFSVIDANGNAVACTETINLGFGSYVVVPETGLLLNNEMDDFAAKPGVPNAFGLVQSKAAAIGPGRRPLSSMTPTLFVKDGKAVLAVGASGGPKIITATLQVLLNSVRFGLDPQTAVDSARQHHQWLPNELMLEPELWERTRKELEGRGHTVVRRGALGVSQLTTRQGDKLRAASDPRKGGKGAGQ